MSDVLRDRRGHRYATEEEARRADAKIAAQEAEQAAKAKREAEAFDAGYRERYMATPGATEADWERDKASVLSEARKRAALADDDLARRQNAQRYG